MVGVFYAKCDGSHLEEVIFPLENPNGIGLSPDGKRLYVAETYTCKLWGFDVASPGKIAFKDGLLGRLVIFFIPRRVINFSILLRWMAMAIFAWRP